jgi:hypothetical protein
MGRCVSNLEFSRNSQAFQGRYPECLSDLAVCDYVARSPLFELALVLVRFDQLASFIVKANLDWIIGRCRFRMVRPVWFRQGKNLSKNLREALRSFRWDTHHIADATDLKFCLLLRFFLKPFLNQGVAKFRMIAHARTSMAVLRFIVWRSPVFEIALVLVRLDHVANAIVQG